MDIPGAWEEIEFSQLSGLLMVIGESDTGKSTFARHLFHRLTQAGHAAAFLDGDPGQSTLGPPSTMTLVVNRWRPGDQASEEPGAYFPNAIFPIDDFSPVAACWLCFIGSVSPHGNMLSMLTGAERLVRAARQAGAQAIVYDTCGLIDPAQGGFALKIAKIELLQPSLVFAIQRGQELEPLLLPLQRSGKARVARLIPSLEVRRRSRISRQAYRAERFAQYFQDARILDLDWRKLAIFPLSPLSLHRLIAFEDRQGYALGLGILLAIDRERKRLSVLTPLASTGEARAIRLGNMALDPHTFQGELMEP